MFCACCLLQRGMVRRTIKNAVKAMINRTEIVYVKPDHADSNQKYLRATLKYLDYADQDAAATLSGEQIEADDAALSEVRQRRVQARDKLACHLAASDIQRGILVKYRHYCPLGCHPSPEEAREDIWQCVDEGHLGLSVPVPAINR